MPPVAAGTVLRGGPVVRALALFAGLSVVLALGLTAPARVWAADWSRSVTFPASSTEDPDVYVDWAAGSGWCMGTLPTTAPNYGWFETNAGGSVGSRDLRAGGNGVGTVCLGGSAGAHSFNWISGLSLQPGIDNFSIDVYWGGDTSLTMSVQWVDGAHGASHALIGSAIYSGATCTTGGSFQGSGACMNHLLMMDLVPTGATGLRFSFSAQSVGVSSVLMGPAHDPVGGDCIGSGALAWGAVGLSGASSWGDQWVPLEAACRTLAARVVLYAPPDWEAGNTYEFTENFSAASAGVSGAVSMTWLGSGGRFFDRATTVTGANAYWRNWSAVAPPGSTGVRWDIGAGTDQFMHKVEDVTIGGPSDPSEQTGLDIFAGCEGPENVLDLAGLAGYIGCVVNNAVYVVTTLVHDSFENMIRALFIPVTLGGEWAAFMDTAGAKVPFGWFAEAWQAVSDGLGAPAAEVGSLAFTMGGAEVDVGDGIAAAVTAVTPFRGLLTAGVVLTMGLSMLRWIMAAVGVAPGGGGEQE